MSLPTGASTESILELLFLFGFFLFIVYFFYCEMKTIRAFRAKYFKVGYYTALSTADWRDYEV